MATEEKTMDVNKEYASKGVAGAGLGTGIAGLALGVLNGAGWLGNLANGTAHHNNNGACGNDVLTAVLAADMLRGRSGGYCGGDCDPVTQREMRLVQEIAAKDSQIALRDANTYNDQKSLELYRYIDGRLMDIEKQLGAQAVQNQATKDSFQLLQERQDCCCQRLETAIQAEARERRCNDNTIVNYVNATFYPKMVADVTTGTTTTAQSTYNPLPVCI